MLNSSNGHFPNYVFPKLFYGHTILLTVLEECLPLLLILHNDLEETRQMVRLMTNRWRAELVYRTV